MRTYSTIQGQTWDQIAYEIFGNEYMCGAIMDANRDKLGIFVFPAGISLNIPETEGEGRQTVPSDYPSWRAMIDAKG